MKIKQSYLLVFLFLIFQTILIRAGNYFHLFIIFFYVLILLFCKFRYNLFFSLWLFFSFFLTLLGIFNGNNIVWIIFDFLIFSPIFLSALMYKINYIQFESSFLNIFSKSLKYLVPLGVIIYFYMGYKPATFNSNRFNLNESIHLAYFSPIMPFLFVPFMILMYDKINVGNRRYFLMAALFIIYMGLITLSRSIVISVILPSFIYLLFIKSGIKIKLLAVLLLGIIYIFMGATVNSSGSVNDLIELINNRNEVQFENGDYTSSRGTELEEYLKQNLSLNEIIFGRGFGGTKVLDLTHDFIGGPEMMHIGWSHAFLKGGILLVLLIYLPLFWILFVSLIKRHVYIFFLAIWFLSADSITTSWQFSYNYFFYSFLIFYFINNYDITRLLSKRFNSLGKIG
jgi:hypothetical protein